MLPLSVVRFIKFSGHHVPDAATFFVLFLHRSFGAVNVLLLLTTRPSLLLFPDPRKSDSDYELGIVKGKRSSAKPSDELSLTSIRTAEELRHDNAYDGETWAATPGDVFYIGSDDAHSRRSRPHI